MIALIAHGVISDLSHTASMLSKFKTIVAIDGGLSHLDKMGIKPSFIIGDLDSCPSALLQKYSDVPLIHDQDPDTTDLEKGLNFFASDEMAIFGALGGRIDHTLTNTILLTRFKAKAFFITEKEKLFAIDQKARLNLHIGQVVSLIPLNGPVKGITTKGLKWELKDSILSKNFIGVSNEAVSSEVEIFCQEGDLLICINH